MKTEKRMIDANDAYMYAKGQYRDGRFTDEEYEAVIQTLDDADTVDAMEVVHARWVKNGWNDYSCSACNCQLIGHGASGWNYCPNCGNTWHTNYNADVYNICGDKKTVKISEHEYEMEE